MNKQHTHGAEPAWEVGNSSESYIRNYNNLVTSEETWIYSFNRDV
ncbi:MAG: hypothetical protein N4A72_17450 [Bacteroidales bacterium]|nr:hypothetical protein [Bacteroidales bacterium]